MLTSQSFTTAAVALCVSRRMASSSPLDFRAAVDSVAQHNHAHRSLPVSNWPSLPTFIRLFTQKFTVLFDVNQK
jgi:hypothetical protein